MDGLGAAGHPARSTAELPLLVLCAFVFVPISTVGGTQVLQPPLAAATLTTLTLMCVLLLWALFTDSPPDDATGSSTSGHPPAVFAPPQAAEATAPLHVETSADVATFHRMVFDDRHFGPSFATILFSFILQQSIPSLIRSAAQPASTRTALVAAVATCVSLYLVLGCSAALYFGAATQPLITLNFLSFRGGAPMGTDVPAWATAVSRWVLLLPLFTTTAAFPLFNRVLAANLEALLPPRLRSKRVAAGLCALPPLLCTALVSDTALVFSLCGLSGFTVVFFVPALLQHAARRASMKRWGEAGRLTPHSTPFSGNATVVGVLAFSVVAFLYNLSGVCELVLMHTSKLSANTEE